MRSSSLKFAKFTSMLDTNPNMRDTSEFVTIYDNIPGLDVLNSSLPIIILLKD